MNKTKRFHICLLLMLLLMITQTNLTRAADPINIGSRLELMVDDALIESRSADARFVMHHPVPREVVLTHDAPLGRQWLWLS